MNIQLFLEGHEIELDKQVSIPLNKAFNNLFNPTDIIVEYSKSVNIPMTPNNNTLMGSLFRVDRTIVTANNQDNIGLYLDPNKKIKMLLIYNGDVVLEGYAKYVSSEYSSSGKYYVLNLFGVLGEVFYKLRQCVADSTLTDDQSYVLDDHCQGLSVDRYTVKNSWYREYPILDINSYEVDDLDIIGFAPAYRGLYPNFHSDNFEQNNTFQPITEKLDEIWKNRYANQRYGKNYRLLNESQQKVVDDYVKGLDSKGVVGSGFKDYQMDEYRSYHQRPYFFFNKLMQMFQEKCPTLTGYTLSLDSSWFNANNPYWTRMCYMCDYNDGESKDRELRNMVSNDPSSANYFAGFIPQGNTSNNYYGASAHPSLTYTTPLVTSSTNLQFGHVNVCNSGVYYDSHYTCLAIQNGDVVPQFTLNPHTVYLLYFTIDGVTKTYWTCPEENKDTVLDQDFTGIDVNPDNYLPMTIDNTYGVSNIYTEASEDTFWNKAVINIPFPPVAKDSSGNFSWSINTYNTVETYVAKTVVPNFTYTGGGQQISITGWDENFTTPSRDVSSYDVANLRNNGSYNITFPIYQIVNGSNTYNIHLKNIYKEEKPLFDIVLQYTKMFGLLWDVDYVNKTINVVPRGKYFSDYTTVDWTDKLDKSKGYSITPVIFPNKYITFNYEDEDGYKYTKYKNKYNANYGAKRVKTGYEFNSQDNDLFSDVKPSMTSNRNVIYYDQLKDWDLISTISSSIDPVERMESANEEDTQSAYTNNWFIRGYNVSKNVTISDDDPYQIGNNFYCYYGNYSMNQNDYTIVSAQMPTFTAAYVDSNDQKFGVLFNMPMEDYTKDHNYDSCEDNYIYDRYWDAFIQERYNTQNKKLTAYFTLTPADYIQLKFNRFVTLQNQLFVINKIFDYDINNNSPTKVELIQITDIEGYANMNGLFEGFYATPSGVNINEAPASGSVYVYVHSEEAVYGNLVTTSAPVSGSVTLVNHGTDSAGITTYQISYSGLGPTDKFEGYINLTSDGQTLRVPIHIERGTYYTLTFYITPDTAEINITES